MKSKKIKKTALAALVVTMSLTLAAPSWVTDSARAATQSVSTGSQEKIFQPPQLGSVFITGKSYIELKKADLVSGADGKNVLFTMKIVNKDNNEIQFMDYWVRLQTKVGSKITARIIDKDKNKNRIPAQSEQEITFYAAINDQTSLQDLLFQIIKWDFSQPNFEKKLGEISIPASYNLQVPANMKNILDMSGSSVKAYINKAKLNKSKEYYQPTIYFTLENVGNTAATVPAYNFQIQTKEGLLYPLTTEIKDLIIQPRDKKEIQLKATIPLANTTSGWKLVVSQNDETLKMNIPVAIYILPGFTTEDPLETTITGQKRDIEVTDDLKISTTVKKLTVSKNDTDQFVNIYFGLENQGSKSINIPNYAFSIRTEDGLVYPLNAAGLEKLVINPKENKEIKLSSSIPIGVKLDNLEMIMYNPAEPETKPADVYKDENTKAIYKVPNATVKSDVSLGNEYAITANSGKYYVKLNSIQRMPWEDQDILAADITITNKGQEALPIPNLSSYIILDGVTVDDASNTQIIRMDNVISIKGNSSIHIMVLTKVPYTYEYSDIKLVLQEQVSKDEKNELVQFKHNSDLLELPILETGSPYEITDIGQRSKVTVGRVLRYEGSKGDVFYAEAEMVNEEKRYADLAALAAYFRTEDDVYFPATITEVKNKISPSGKALIAIYANIPKQFKTSNLQLIMGKAVNGSDGKPNAFIQVVKAQLPIEKYTTKFGLNDLDIYPYTISFTKMNVPIESLDYLNGFTVNYTYNVKLSDKYENIVEGHEVVVEIRDKSDKILKTEKISLVDKEGITQSGSLNISDPNVEDLKGYTVYIYDQFQGGKRFLVSKGLELSY